MFIIVLKKLSNKCETYYRKIKCHFSNILLKNSYIKFIAGFTLLELLIAITIIGILTAIALPSYERYLKKARFSEVILATEPYKTAIALDLQDGIAQSQLNTGKYDIPKQASATENLQSVTVTNGVITAVATKRIDNKTYILTPDATGSHWKISGTCLSVGLCRS